MKKILVIAKQGNIEVGRGMCEFPETSAEAAALLGGESEMIAELNRRLVIKYQAELRPKAKNIKYVIADKLLASMGVAAVSEVDDISIRKTLTELVGAGYKSPDAAVDAEAVDDIDEAV